MTDKQYADAQRNLGIIEGFAAGLGDNGILLRNAVIRLYDIANELHYPSEELRIRMKVQDLRADAALWSYLLSRHPHPWCEQNDPGECVLKNCAECALSWLKSMGGQLPYEKERKK